MLVSPFEEGLVVVVVEVPLQSERLVFVEVLLQSEGLVLLVVVEVLLQPEGLVEIHSLAHRHLVV